MTDQPAYFAYGSCFACGDCFTFNPHLVPSVPVNAQGIIEPGGTRRPLCRSCATKANVARKAAGLLQWDVSDAAYGVVEGLPE